MSEVYVRTADGMSPIGNMPSAAPWLTVGFSTVVDEVNRIYYYRVS